MKAEICPESMVEITRAELKLTLKFFKKDLRQRKTDTGSPVFCLEKTTDIEQINQHIEATEMLLRYYRGLI